MNWIKSSYSSNGSCVEVLRIENSILVRDSKNPEQVLEFTIEEWDAFIMGAKKKEFDFDL